jgi:hypothetical protein
MFTLAVHTADYMGIFYRVTFPLPYPLESPYVPTKFPTAGSMDCLLPGHWKNPCVVHCVERTPIETLMLQKLGSRKSTAQNDLYQ